MDEETTKISNGCLEEISDMLGQYVRHEWAYPLPTGFTSDEDTVDNNYTEALVRRARINPALINRICELYLRERNNK